MAAIRSEAVPPQRLIPVAVIRERRRVILVSPRRDEIPFGDFVAAALNAALLAQYPGLKPTASAEGGVHGTVGHFHLGLANVDEHVGLEPDEDWHEAWSAVPRPVDWVLTTYERILRQLFERRMLAHREHHRPGAILWLDPNEPTHRQKAWHYLTLAFSRFGGSTTVSRVQALLGEENGTTTRFLRGLSDAEVSAMFTLPPEIEMIPEGREP